MTEFLLDPRIWDKVEADGDCWIWQGTRTERGWAQWTDSRNARKKWRVHRLVYMSMVGDIPDGLTLDHLCQRKLCINPYHMEPVPSVVNQARWAASRTKCRNGHEVTPETTYHRSRGDRECRLCITLSLGRRRNARTSPV